MNETTYQKLIVMYLHQCGVHTDLYLRYVMAAKWELSTGGY